MASILKAKQHKSLLIKLCDMMDPNDPTYQNFILFLSASIPEGRLTRVHQNPADVFALMEERGILDVGKYQDLEEALKASGYINILNVLENEGKLISRLSRKRRQSDDPMAEEAATVSSVSPEAVRDIQLLLIKAYESVKIISINPVFDTAVNWKDLEDFYTDIVIEEDKEESAQRINDEQQFNKKVMSFRQIFEKDGKKVTRIILKAPAGHGKSTFCLKLVHTWCSVQMKKLNNLIDDGMSNKSEKSSLKDEDEMLRFDVLLYICLRDISDEKTLMDVVNTQFPLDESEGLFHNCHIEALIRQAEENKVLLIMDGLDEMDNSSSFIKKIMQKRLHPHLTVLATTRPWKIGQLNLIRSAHIDLLLDLQGFIFDNSMLFAERIFDKYYKNECAIAKFVKDIKRNTLIRSLVHVPLLLLFIVHVWYERKSFPQKIHHLYLEMLNVMVSRYMEGKKRKENNKERQDENLLQKFCMAFILTPKLRNLSLVQHFGEEFLASLCEVANHFLVTACGETSLVFDEEALLELLGKDGTSELQTALDLGILSKSESPGIFRKRIRLTFLHKTVQEFLAAINICCRWDRCSIFLDSLNTLDDVFQNEQIIKFAAGISTTQCQKIFEKIYEVCDKDKAVAKNGRSMRLLCTLYKNCVMEACGEPVNLKLYCMYVDNELDWNVLQPVLSTTSNVRTNLKWLTLSYFLDDATLDLSESNCLEYLSLNLNDVTINGKLLLSKCTHLKCLNLYKCSIDDATLDLSESNFLEHVSLVYCSLDDTILHLPKSSCLESLCLSNVTMKSIHLPSKYAELRYLKLRNYTIDDSTLDLSESNCLEYLSIKIMTMKGGLLLSKCTQLKCLKMDDCMFHDATLDLSESNCLEYLSLNDVTINGKLLLSKCTQLRCLNLYKCSLDNATLEFSESNCLEILILNDVTMNGKLLLSKCPQLKFLKLRKCCVDDATLDLSESNCLQYLSIKDVTIKSNILLSKCIESPQLKLHKCHLDDATLDLSESLCLGYLHLKDVTMKGIVLLSKYTQLKHLELDDCTLYDATLDLSDSNSLEYLSLQYVTMNGKLLLSKCPQLRCVKLKDCTLDDARVNFSESNCLECLSLVEVTMKGKLLLSKCTHLKCLKLQQCTLDDATLDLSESNCLEHLSLECLTIKGKILPSKYNQLKHLKLRKCHLDDATLDLSESHCLEHLSLVDVTIKGKILLLKCTQLNSLELDNCTFDDGILDLLESNRLERFLCNKMTFTSRNRLSNCTLPKQLMLVKCSLGEMILDLLVSTSPVKQIQHDESQCNQLQSFSMKNAHLGDALLSLDNVDYLNALSLDDVTMSKECKVLLCNSLSQCNNLYRLSIKNVDLCDVLFSLDNVDYLNELNLDNVTMSKECKEVFCNSLSKCKQLHRLSIKNVDLGDALLRLDSFNNLNKLSLDNVTMSKECKEMFYTSLSHRKQLHRLSIKNVDLCDTLFSLDSLDFLDELNLDNLEMDKISILICQCLSSCARLSTVSLKNLHMSDGLLNLDNGEQLDNLTIDNVTMCKNGYVMLCNSLSRCTQLEHLQLMNLDLGDAQFNFDKTKKKLYHLTIDNVTMCENGYVMLFKSMSLCTQLKHLVLKNLNIGNALLSFYKTKTRLYHLTMDNVTICKNGYVMLLNSLSWCTELKHLELKNLDLADALLKLDKTEMLYSLTIDNVTMCKSGYVMLCNSMSTCKQLKHLNLKNLDLADAKPGLDNLEEFKLVNITMSLEYVDYIKSSVQHQKSRNHKVFTGELIINKVADSCERCVVNYTNNRVLDYKDDYCYPGYYNFEYYGICYSFDHHGYDDTDEDDKYV